VSSTSAVVAPATAPVLGFVTVPVPTLMQGEDIS
jgi:hypothetical protein